ncbi:MAG: ABC transporter ATP-binding protein [Chloroflexia bacterium]|nr:ABC transporter ATP-binding protein [Chloroflexia bacterium]
MLAIPAIRASRLSVRFLTRRVAALRDVDLTVYPGERVLVAGASGSGKSTLGLSVTGLIPTSVDADIEGWIEVAGTPTVEYAPGALARRVGIVFQDPSSQFTMLTVGDEVAFGLENIGVDPSAMPERVAASLAAVGLSDRADWRIDRLSGGQQQRVALAATLAMRPNTLVLDEPTAHLDPRSGTELYTHLQSVATDTGTALLLVEHDTDKVVPSLAERCLLLGSDGRVELDRSARNLFGDVSCARHWSDAGLQLPAAAAIYLAIDAEDADISLEGSAAATWMARNPAAQRRLRTARCGDAKRAPGDVVLDARALWRRFSTPAGDHQALKGVDLVAREGELVAVVGRNGSGKTTLLRALSGLIRLDRGEVRLEGQRTVDLGLDATARLIAHVFQNPESGFVAATVRDEIAHGPQAMRWNQAARDKFVTEALKRFGLEAVAAANPYTLSGGQKRRLSVAAALAYRPRVLLLDEPTFGQDRQSAEALLNEVATLREAGAAVIAATHDSRVIAEEADRVVALVDGAVAFEGSPGDFYADEELLAITGQEVPALRRILVGAQALGADVPIDGRWRIPLAMSALADDWRTG